MDNGCAALGLGNDEVIVVGVAAGIYGQAPADFVLVNFVVEHDRGNAPLDFLAWVFEVPVPDIQWTRRRAAEQVAPCRHADRLDKT